MKFARVLVAGCAVMTGCCFSYESDVNKLCNIQDTCSAAYNQKGVSSADRQQLLSDCLKTKLYTSHGRALLESMSGLSPRDKSVMLRHEAKTVGLNACPWADAMMDLPPAPASCQPLPDDEFAVEIMVDDSISTRPGDVVLRLETKEVLAANGFDKKYKAAENPDSLEVVPIRDAVAKSRATVLASSKMKEAGGNPASLAAILFVNPRRNPMPERMSRELVHSIGLAGITDVRQAFQSSHGGLCSAPFKAAPAGK